MTSILFNYSFHTQAAVDVSNVDNLEEQLAEAVRKDIHLYNSSITALLRGQSWIRVVTTK